VHRAVFEAELLDVLPIVAGPVPAAAMLRSRAWEGGGPISDLARSSRTALRWPSWDDLELFERWAKEPVLDHLVGSELLYRCRHLGAYHPEFVDSLLNDQSSLTVLVEPLAAPRVPVGFVRFFNINLAQGFAFMESTIADPTAMRRGLGVEATRLLSFYALDALRLRRLEAKVYAYNVLSVNALRRNGFQPEGVLRQARTCGGRTWDILVFAILDDEIREQRRKGDWPYMGLWE
jgi:RimJ/RimL family protein N-acetyltransferase